VFLGCVSRCQWLEISGCRGIEFQMTGTAERKEREPKLVLDGGRRSKKVLIRGAKRANRMMIVNVRRNILRRVCLERFICYRGKLETNSSVNR